MSFRVATHVHWRRVADEIVLVDLEDRQYFALDAVGAYAWERLQRGEDVAAIAAAVAEDFEVDESTARADLEALVGELVAAGLLLPE